MNFVEEEERKIKNILFDEDFQRREFHADLRWWSTRWFTGIKSALICEKNSRQSARRILKEGWFFLKSFLQIFEEEGFTQIFADGVHADFRKWRNII